MRLSNVLAIASNELAEARRGGVLPVLGALVLSLVLLSAVVGYESYAAAHAERARYQEIVRGEWKAQPDRHPHRVSHYGFLVFRPRAPLSYLDLGVDSYAGTSLYLEPHRQNTVNFTEAGHSTAMIRFGEMSTAAILQLLVPLLVFFVGATSITRERENGTLPLVLCQGVPFGAVIAGKTIGILALVASWLVPALAMSTAFLALATEVPLDADVARRAAILLACYAAFFVACALASVTASALHRTSRGALTTMVCAWVFLFAVVPRGLATLGEALYPAPSKAEFDAALEREIRQVGDSHNPADPHFLALKEGLLAEHGVSELSELPLNYKGVVMLEAEKATTDVFRRRYRRLLDVHNEQNAVVRWGAFVDPYLALRGISMALAGTDSYHFADFYRQSEEYRFELVQTLNRLHTERVAYDRDVYVRPESGPPSRERISRELFRNLPAFDYRPPDVELALARSGKAFAALLLWLSLTLFGALWVAIRRVPA